MRKVFWENPYQTSLDTKVASVNGNEVVFEDTIATRLPVAKKVIKQR